MAKTIAKPAQQPKKPTAKKTAPSPKVTKAMPEKSKVVPKITMPSASRVKTASSSPSAHSTTSSHPAFQTLLDKNDIREVLFRFARGVDRIDETLLRSIFHHDATLDLGPGVFQGSSNDYIHWVIGVMNGIRSSHHTIANVLPTMEGDVALVESYCHAHFRLDKPTGREDVFIGSRYLDRFERRPTGSAGVWKIAHRKQIIDWARTEAVSDLFYHQNPDALWSYRTKTDPSYQMAQFPGSQSGQRLPSFLGRHYDSKSVKF